MASRLLFGSLALLLLAGTSAAQLTLDPISPAEGTFGTVITITGTGDFGKGKPKVTLETEGEKPVKLKVLTIETVPDATTITAELKKAKVPAAYALTVQAKGKNGASGTAPNTFEIQPPVLLDTPTTGDVNTVVQVLTQWTGEKKVKFKIGGKKAKGKLSEVITDGGPGVLTWDVTIPKSLANGLAQLEVSNKLGTDSTKGLDGIQVTGSNKKLGKDSLTGNVDGAITKVAGKTIGANFVQLAGNIQINASKGNNPNKAFVMTIPFDMVNDTPPMTFTIADFATTLQYIETKVLSINPPQVDSKIWSGMNMPWSITIEAVSAGQVRGSFSGTLEGNGLADADVAGEFIVTPEFQ